MAYNKFLYLNLYRKFLNRRNEFQNNFFFYFFPKNYLNKKKDFSQTQQDYLSIIFLL